MTCFTLISAVAAIARPPCFLLCTLRPYFISTNANYRVKADTLPPSFRGEEPESSTPGPAPIDEAATESSNVGGDVVEAPPERTPTPEQEQAESPPRTSQQPIVTVTPSAPRRNRPPRRQRPAQAQNQAPALVGGGGGAGDRICTYVGMLGTGAARSKCRCLRPRQRAQGAVRCSSHANRTRFP